jgi:hypothetical protein
VYKIPTVIVMAISVAVIISIRPTHFPGVCFVAGCGQLAGYMVEHLVVLPGQSTSFKENAAPVIAAIAVTLAARLIGQKHYFVYLVDGIMLLVPGGVGVKVSSKEEPVTGFAVFYGAMDVLLMSWVWLVGVCICVCRVCQTCGVETCRAVLHSPSRCS